MVKESHTVEGWPSVTWESVAWQSQHDIPISRTQRRLHQGPYDAAVTPLIAECEVVTSREARAAALDATTNITRFDERASHRLGGGELGPIDTVLLRTESASSSQIENLTAGARQLAMAVLKEPVSRNATIVARNVEAMRAATGLAKDLTVPAVLDTHRALLHGIDPGAGKLRDQQVWIGGGQIGPHHAEFVPPRHERVPAALDDLARFMDRDDIPPLIQAAIAHAQFETIHPFTDGNGRTGRALVHALLRNKEITQRVTVPVSAGLLTDVGAYFDALAAYRDGDVNPIVQQFAEASFEAIGNGERLLTDLEIVRGAWSERITARRTAAAWGLAEALLAQPAVTAGFVAEKLEVSVPTALAAIDHLTEVGIMTLVKKQTRNRVWQAPEVVDALDAFARRAGRRRRSG
ncbi:Fic family protein [Solicola sp. PLA-1-18]|uniref:Fic family protein n=1 Tax=Solicola sp. PLA-1-18 TaxID=3380532 RepID=UPI003B7E8F32